MGSRNESILRLVEKINENPCAPSQWESILGLVVQRLRLRSAVTTWRQPGFGSRVGAHWGLEDGAAERFNQAPGAYDPWVSDISSSFRTGQVTEIFSKKDGIPDLHSSPLYERFLEPAGIRDHRGLILAAEPGLVVTLSLLRAGADGPFSKGDEQLLGILTPHLVGRLSLERSLGNALQAQRTLEQLLEAGQVAWLVLDERLSMIYANAEASGLLSAGDGLCLSRSGRLQVLNVPAARGLDRALRHGLALGKEESLQPPTIVRVPRPSGKPDFSLTVRPLVNDALLGPGDQGLLVLISDPDQVGRTAGTRLVELFGLTQAEAQVAVMLLSGFSTRQIATSHGVSVNTVRTQVRAVLEKSATNSQAQFVSLAFRTLGQILH